MDPRVNEFQQILLARGIRLQEDDPLFALLVLNEVQFDRLAAKHYQALDKRMIVTVVTSILERQPKEVIKCQGGLDAEMAARKLESAANYFVNLENRTADLARVVASTTARVAAEKTLGDLTRRIEAELTRLEVIEEQAVRIGDVSARISDNSSKILQGAKLIYTESRKARLNLVWLSLAYSFFMAIGIYIGHNVLH